MEDRVLDYETNEKKVRKGNEIRERKRSINESEKTI